MKYSQQKRIGSSGLPSAAAWPLVLRIEQPPNNQFCATSMLYHLAMLLNQLGLDGIKPVSEALVGRKVWEME
jgi:hypothetical protein